MSDITHINLSWTRITQDCKTLAEIMQERNMVRKDTVGILAMARGGLAVAQLMAYYLDIRRVESLTVVSYDGVQENSTALAEAKILGTMSADIKDGKHWIVIDDLVDTGRTYKYVRNILPEAHYVALYAKPQGLEYAQASVQTFAQDSWIDFPWEVKPISEG